MSKKKRLWGIYGIDRGWHCHDDGEPMLSSSRDEAAALRAVLQPQCSERLAVISVPIPERKKKLYGLWYEKDYKPCWVLDAHGMPTFSRDKRLVMAHRLARNTDYSVREVNDDGRPAGATSPHVAAAVEQCVPASNRQLALDFLELPHHARLEICSELGLPWDHDTGNSAAQFAPSFLNAANRGALDTLRRAVAEAKDKLANT